MIRDTIATNYKLTVEELEELEASLAPLALAFNLPLPLPLRPSPTFLPPLP